MKIYHSTKLLTYFLIISGTAILIALIYGFVFFKTWFYALGILVVCLYFFGCLRSNVFTPTYVFPNIIRFKGKSYEWKDILIVAVVVKHTPIHNAYDLFLFKDDKVSIDIMGNEKICKVQLTKKNIDVLLSYYEKEIFIFDPESEQLVDELKTSRKLKRKIQTHNLKKTGDGSES